MRGFFFGRILPERTQQFRFCLKHASSFKNLLQSAGEVSAAHLRCTKYVGQVCEGKACGFFGRAGRVCVSCPKLPAEKENVLSNMLTTQKQRLMYPAFSGIFGAVVCFSALIIVSAENF